MTQNPDDSPMNSIRLTNKRLSDKNRTLHFFNNEDIASWQMVCNSYHYLIHSYYILLSIHNHPFILLLKVFLFLILRLLMLLLTSHLILLLLLLLKQLSGEPINLSNQKK